MTDTITVAYGDGIGPEIMDAVLLVLKEAGANLAIETIEVGEAVYNRGLTSGISQKSLEIIKKNKVFLKAPITTPQGGGYKSLNVTTRKLFGLYANVRPCKALHPYVQTKHPELDIIVVRENEEDLYAGIEYRQTHNAYQSLKLITRTGCERIIRFAFEYAVSHNRKKVTCLSKDNIMKFTDGLFHKVFDEIGQEYSGIEQDHYIVDIGFARVANRPEQFDVLVTENLYGDIISDVVAEICGSVGLAGSANIGTDMAMFEAIHGSAPRMAGQNTANPSGLLNAAIMMLVHLGQMSAAAGIHNAWLKTLEDGIHTKDIYQEGVSKEKVGTAEFARAVIHNLGNKPESLGVVEYKSLKTQTPKPIAISTKEKKVLVGVDVFIDSVEHDIEKLATTINKHVTGELQLQNIASRGLKVWPKEGTISATIQGDHWCLRFVPHNKHKTTSHAAILEVLNALNGAGVDFIQTENLYTFDDKLGFSLSQGE